MRDYFFSLPIAEQVGEKKLRTANEILLTNATAST